MSRGPRPQCGLFWCTSKSGDHTCFRHPHSTHEWHLCECGEGLLLPPVTEN